MDGDVYKIAADFSPINEAVESATKAFIEMQTEVDDVFEKISKSAAESTEEIVQDSVITGEKIAKALGTDILAPVKTAWSSMQEAARARADGMKAAVQSAFQTMNEYFPTFTSAASSSFNAVSGASSVMWAAITGGASYVVGAIGKAFSMLTAPISTAFSAVKSVVTGVFSGIWSAAKSVAGVIGSAFSAAAGAVKSAFSGLFGIIKEILPLAGVGLFAGLAVGLKELQATEQAFTRVKAAVAATGGVAGFTTQQLQAMADQMAENTRFGDDVALSAQAVALQFKNVRGDVFKQALELSADAAIAWGTDLTGATDKVARALDDPLEGFRVLKSEGVKFNEEQKLVIEQMLRMGNVAGAQKIILEGLRNTVGGQAAADVKTFSGALAQVNNAMGDAWKAIAGALIPALKPVVEWFRSGADTMASWAPTVGKAVGAAIEWFESFRPVIKEWVDWGKAQFASWANWIIDKTAMAAAVLQVAIPNAIEFIKTAMKAPGKAWEWVWAEGQLAFERLKNSAFDAIDSILKKIKDASQPLVNTLTDAIVDALDTVESKLNHKLAGMSAVMKKFLGITMTEQDAAMVDESVANLRKSERTLRKTQQDMIRKNGGGRFDGVKFIAPDADPQAQKAAEERKRQVDALTARAEEARRNMADIGDFTSPDFQAWQKTADMIKEQLKGLLGGTDFELPPELDPKNVDSPFSFNKEAKDETSSAGKFEDLLSLQKRITGAASAVSPETKELSKQTAFMIVQHKETVANQKKLIEVVEKNKPQPQEAGLAP